MTFCMVRRRVRVARWMNNAPNACPRLVGPVGAMCTSRIVLEPPTLHIGLSKSQLLQHLTDSRSSALDAYCEAQVP